MQFMKSILKFFTKQKVIQQKKRKTALQIALN